MIFTIITLLSIHFSTVPLSFSKYYKDGRLSYNSVFLQLQKGGFSESMALTSPSTYEKISVTFSFPRNDVIRELEKETYTVNIPDGCSLTSMKENLESGSAGLIDKNQVTYVGKGAATLNVVLTCDVPKRVVGDKIQIPVSITQMVEGDIASFTYMSGLREYDEQEYLDNHLQATTDLKVMKNTSSIYDDLKHLLEKSYIPSYVEGKYNSQYVVLMRNAILKYIEKFKEANSANIDSYKTIRDGIVIDTTSDPLYYIFHIQDSFIAYAMTYTQDINQYMYFNITSKDESTIQNILSNYISYLFPNDVAIVSDYLSKRNFVAYIIGNEENIPGLSKYVDSMNSNFVRIDISKLLEEIKKPEEKEEIIEVKFDSRGNMTNSYIEEVKTYCGGSCLSEDMISILTGTSKPVNLNILGAVVKNRQNSISEAFNYYFLVENYNVETEKTERIVLHIYSAGGTGVSTFVTIIPLSMPEMITATYSLSTEPNNLQIKLSTAKENKDTLEAFAKELYKAFGIEDALITTTEDEGGNVNAEFTISIEDATIFYEKSQITTNPSIGDLPNPVEPPSMDEETKKEEDEPSSSESEEEIKE